MRALAGIAAILSALFVATQPHAFADPAETPMATTVPRVTSATPEPFPYTILRIPVDTSGTLDDPRFAETFGRLIAIVDERVCASVSLVGPGNTDSDGHKVIVIGTSDQPRACGEAGREIVLVNGQGNIFQPQLTTEPGTSRIVSPRIAPPGTTKFAFGFVNIRLSIEDEGLLTGDGRSPPFLVLAGVSGRQPISLASALAHAFPFEPSGEMTLALPVGDYFVFTSSVQLKLLDPSDSVTVQANRVLTMPAVRVTVGQRQTARLDLQGVREPIASPGPPITPPIVGDAGLR